MSSPVIDPFKFKTYGVKKPLDEKEEKIQKLLDDNKRYYPTTKNGSVDEWGAVIKHQAEQHQVHQQHAQQLDKMHKNAYKEELQKEFERKKQEQDLQSQIKHRELEIQKEYKRQQEEKINFLRNQEQLTKMSVTNLNKRQMNEMQQRNYQAKELDREAGQKMAEEAQREQRQYEELMRLKKDTFTRQFQDDLQEKQKQKQYEQIQKDYEREEIKKMQEYNAQKQMQNQVEFRERLNKINEQEKVKNAIFQKSIEMSPTKKGFNMLSNDNNQDTNSFLKQIQDLDIRGQNQRYNYLQNTNDVIKNQMIQKEQQKSLERQNMQVEQQVQKEYGFNLNQSQLDKLSEKKRQQQQYRDLLDSQVTVQKQMYSGFGNMTNVEKKFNRADLLAYKSYDNQQYSLIPGIQNKTLQKKIQGYQPTNTLLGGGYNEQQTPNKGGHSVNKTIDYGVYQNLPSGTFSVNQSVSIDKSSRPFQDMPAAGGRSRYSHSRNRSLRNSSVGNFRPTQDVNHTIGGIQNINGQGMLPAIPVNLNSNVNGMGGIMSANVSIANFDRQMNKERATALKYAATNILI